MRWGGILAVAAALACAGTAAAQTPAPKRCGGNVAPWRLSAPAPLVTRTCATKVGLHGGTTETVVLRGSRVVLRVVSPQWHPAPGADRSRSTPLPLAPRTQVFWHAGTRLQLHVLEHSAAVHAVVRSLRFVD